MLAQTAISSIWVPAAGVVMGLALLGVLVTLALRKRTAQPNHGMDNEELDRLKRAGDRVSLLTAAAEETADALDERINALRSLLSIADERIDNAKTAGRAAACAPSEMHVESKPSTVASMADPLTRAVYELADGGEKPVEIASRLGEHVGKVELILNLRRSAAAAGSR